MRAAGWAVCAVAACGGNHEATPDAALDVPAATCLSPTPKPKALSLGATRKLLFSTVGGESLWIRYDGDAGFVGFSFVIERNVSGEITGCGISHDGRAAVSSFGGQILGARITDAGVDPRAVLSGLAADADEPTWSPDSRYVAYRAGGGYLHIVDVEAPTCAPVQIAYTNGPFEWTADSSAVLATNGAVLFAAAPDGHMTEIATAAGDIQVAPKGHKFVFAVGTFAQTLWVADATIADSATNVTNIDDYSQIVWAPDGDHIAVVASSAVVVADVSTATPSTVVVSGTTQVSLTPLRWSPDSRALAYAAGSSLYVAKADGSSAPMTITATFDTVHDYFEWSPAGDKLLYIAGSDIFFADVAGAGVAERHADTTLWSPDGTRIAFNRGIGSPTPVTGSVRTYVMTPGGSPVAVAPDLIGARFAWSPDSKALWLAPVGDDAHDTLYVVSLDGVTPSEVREADPQKRQPVCVTWAP